jgi:hypothetical protein
MSRAVTIVDRLAALLVGLALIAVGVGVLVWGTGLIADRHDVVTMPGLVTITDTAWWPWVTTGAGVVLVLGGMRWLMSHGPAQRVRQLTLPGSGRTGRLSADLGALANAAAANLNSHAAVRSAKGKALLDHGVPAIYLDATATSADTLADVTAAADDIATTTATVIGDMIAVRTRLHVDTKHRAPRRLT